MASRPEKRTGRDPAPLSERRTSADLGAGRESVVRGYSVQKGFRIADSRHAIFDGEGASLFGGRWNSPGRKVIYAADSFAGAMLEMLVHTRIAKAPRSHAWIEFSIPDDMAVDVLASGALTGWNANESPAARAFGDEWYDSQRSLILTVPSVVTNGLTRNLLINQDHKDFLRLKASEPYALVWDLRLFGR